MFLNKSRLRAVSAVAVLFLAVAVWAQPQQRQQAPQRWHW
jgi:hypothetical protein